jgi:hypothetical protein
VLYCTANAYTTTQRHNRVCNLLERLIRRHLPDSNCVKEPVLATTPGRPSIKGDLMFVHRDGRRYVIDVTITHPGAGTYIRDNHSHLHSDRAAVRREEEKTLHYRQVPQLVESGLFIPFAIEATGRLGPQALAFVQDITREDSYSRNTFVDAVGLSIARATAQAALLRGKQPPPIAARR